MGGDGGGLGGGHGGDGEGHKAQLPGVMADARFSALFDDPRYTIDEEAPEYIAQHPHAAKRRAEVAALVEE